MTERLALFKKTGNNISTYHDDCSEADVIKTHDMKDISNRLHETLDMYQLFEIFANELRKTVPFDGYEFEDESTESFLMMGVQNRYRCNFKLRYDEQTLGNLTLARNSEFLESELIFIEVMIAGLTLPLRNSLRYKQAALLGNRDELTGLRNRNSFYDVIDIEIKRAHRYKTPFSLLIFDIDSLADINNKYGRDAGDSVIVEVARKIELKARTSDVVYRYLGGRYFVMLPATDDSKALEASKRIKEFVLADRCVLERGVVGLSLSVAAVTVAYDDTVSSFMDKANKSLSQVKLNRITAFTAELSDKRIQTRYV